MMAIEARFWPKVNKTQECWLWIGYRDARGYGRIMRQGKVCGTHRVSWEIHNGQIPEGMGVLHSCDNPPCVNPQHLFIGTQKDNMRDCTRKGRAWYVMHPDRVASGERHGSRTHPESRARGERHGSRTHPERLPKGERHKNSKLTSANVREIRTLYAGGKYSKSALAIQFKISLASISLIVRRKAWKHIP